MILRIVIERLGAFRSIALSLSPGLNVVTGMNGTGKTHLLRILHAGCHDTVGRSFGSVLAGLFDWEGERFDRLLFRATPSLESTVRFDFPGGSVSARVRRPAPSPDRVQVRKTGRPDPAGGSLLFPVPLPESPVSGRNPDRTHPSLGAANVLIEKSLPGRIVRRGGTYRMRNTKGELEIALASSSARQLAALSLMIRRRALVPGALLLWDTPEADIGPTLMGEVVSILMELAKAGVQIVLATRDYVLLKECDLRRPEGIPVLYHALYRDDRDDRIAAASWDEFSVLSPNPASDAFRSLFDRDVDRAFRRAGTP